MSNTISTAHHSDLDCGHRAEPTHLGFDTGYATEADTGRKVCYSCAADVDRAYAASMTKDSAPLCAYVQDQGGSRIDVVTWPGIKLGWGFKTGPQYDSFGNRVQYVRVTIDGRGFYGRHYPDAGDYIRLRPLKR